MNRFDGYNRHDYHFPTSSREAFGSNFYPEEPKLKVNVFSIAAIVGFVILFVLILK